MQLYLLQRSIKLSSYSSSGLNRNLNVKQYVNLKINWRLKLAQVKSEKFPGFLNALIQSHINLGLTKKIIYLKKKRKSVGTIIQKKIGFDPLKQNQNNKNERKTN